MVRVLLSAVSILVLSTTVFGMQSNMTSDSLESMFACLCKNITGFHYVTFHKDFSRENEKLIFNVVERKEKSLEDLAKDLLTNKDVSKNMIDCVYCDRKSHSHFYYVAHALKQWNHGEIFTDDLVPLSDGSDRYQRGDRISFDLHLTLNVILRVADHLKSEGEQGETFAHNYEWLKKKLQNECITYIQPMFEEYIKGILQTSDIHDITKILIEGVNEGKIDREWFIAIISKK